MRGLISQFLFGKKTRVALPDYIKSVADEIQGVLKQQLGVAMELEKLEGMLRNQYSTSREEWLGSSNLGAGLFSMDGTKLHAEMKVRQSTSPFPLCQLALSRMPTSTGPCPSLLSCSPS